MNRTYLLGLAVAVATVLFLVVGMGALGIIGDGGRQDLMYTVPVGLALLGALAARFRAAGMALSLGVAAVATVGVGLVAIGLGYDDEPGASVGEILMLSGMYAALFAGSAWLFRRSADATPATG